MDGQDARVPTISPRRPFRGVATTFGALVWAGFRRWASYRQATMAGSFTNIVFGFLRCYVLLAVAAATVNGRPAGYDETQLVTYVWVGQGLLTVVALLGWSELSDRIRSGEVTVDLLRPVHPVVSYLAPDLGRALHRMMTRFVPPVLVGALVFDLYVPGRWWTVPLFAVSVVLAVVISFGCRFLVNATAFWLHDARGPVMLWTLAGGALAGLYFPLRLLPHGLAVLLWVGTPFPGMLQTPLDVLTERDPPALQAGLVGLQVVWAGALLAACAAVQRRAERRLVAQGG
ncbi:ABC-2 type transport system permease protein [Krasilnikovia cinnamomea]|uniref:ABC-2 type transport system permease protein n=1 Tax=Krasilnikovia cinnamomea TaxID=349313 RepID=A0A4Q7ZP62_9ACTN|nr:ABC-2 family transporter protein [Krasilnikovia cinnamomea]RZU52848.1 ABC-2 type transport system permease protein [Krasilnikovia cinnamomea]